jgi:membrane protease YdiL (CAAX protease family)
MSCRLPTRWRAAPCAATASPPPPPRLGRAAARRPVLARARDAERAAQEARRRAPSAPPSRGAPRRGPPFGSGDDDEAQAEFEEAFRVFDWPAYAAPFGAPWPGADALIGMGGWVLSFVAVGVAFIPAARALAGDGGLAAVPVQSKALLTLANQAAATAAGVWVIRSAAARSNGGEVPSGALRLDLSAPFCRPDGWGAWGGLGVLLAPAVVFAASAAVSALGAEDPAARGTADAVSGLLSMDPVTFAALFTTTAILAPLLEETVFRGFLLPSLARYMPTPAAVALSSLAFGLVHLSPRDTPQLAALGLLLGFTYVRSRNLAAPMLIHGAWNGTVLTLLYYLSSQGVDLQSVLHGGN